MTDIHQFLFRKGVVRVLYCLCAVLSLFGMADKVASASDREDITKISVVYSKDSIPFHYSNQDGEPEGLIIDYWRLWSQKTGIDIEFIPAGWNETLSMIREGKVDAHAGLFFSEERAEYLDYGTTLRRTDTHVFYDKRLPRPNDNNDFIPYRIGLIRGDFVETWLMDKFPKAKLTGFEDYESIMAAIDQGYLLVFAADTPTALYHLQKSGLKENIKYMPNTPLYQNDWYVAVQKGDTTLLELINKGFTQITEKEKKGIARQWATGSKKEDTGELIVAVSSGYHPFSGIGLDGDPTGMLVDIWRLWGEQNGIPVVFKISSWAESLEAVRSGEADIHSGLFKNDERAKWLSFSLHVFEVETAVYYLASREEPFELGSARRKSVGAMTGSFQEKFLQRNYPEIETVSRTDNESLVLALIRGEIEAFIHETPVVDADLARLGLVGLVTKGETLFSETIYAGVSKDRQDLLSQINEGFNAIPVDLLAAIETRWLPNATTRFYKETADIGLTSQEKRWIRNNPTFTIAATPNWPPFEFKEKDQYQGLHADVIRLAAAKAGLKAEPVFDKWSSLVEKLKKGELDLCPGLNATEERKEYLVFTDDAISETSEVIIAPATAPIGSIKELFDKTVVVEQGYATESFLKENFPEVKLLPVSNTLEALKAIITRKAEAYLGNQAVALYLIKENRFSGIEVTAFFDEAIRSEYRIGVIKEKPILRDVLQKALVSISNEEMSALHRKWFGVASIIKDKPALKLSEEEERWREEHPVIRVAAVSDWPPFEYQDTNGDYAGISADILRLAAERAEFEVELVFDKWSSLYEQLKERKLDLAPGLVRNEERQDFLLFTDSFATSDDVIWTRDDEEGIASMEDLEDKTVAVEKNYSTHNLLKSDYPEIKILEVDTTLQAIDALSKGQADAYIGSKQVGTYEKEKNYINNIRVVTAFSSDPQRLRMGIRKDYQLLHSIMQKALDSITHKEQVDIISSYVSLENKVNPVELSKDEKIWLRELGELRLGVDPSFPPLELVDSNTGYGGIVSEYVSFFSSQLDVEMNPVPGLDWQEVLSKAKAGEIDVLPGLVKTSEREQYLNFTKPYLTFPVVIFGHKEGEFISGIDNLKGMRVSVVEGYFTQDFLSTDYPDLALTTFKNIEDALMALSKGEVDVFVNDMATASYTINSLNIPNLNVVAMTPYKLDLAVGVRKDWPQLVSILDKTFDTVTPQLADEFKEKWLSIKFTVGLSLKSVLKWALPVAGALTFIIFFIGMWNRRLGKEISERKSAEEALSKSEVKYRELVENANSIIIKLDVEGNITFFNEFAQKFFGFSSEEVLGRSIVGTIVAEKDSEGLDLTNLIQDVINQPELYEKNENENVCKNGDRVWVSWTNRAIRSTNENLVELLCIGTDITERRKAEKERDEAFGVITSSINYASRIQRAILPSVELLEKVTKEYFILWDPRDVVGGDIYWCHQWGKGTVLILADCTGHGVPGAFMTLISSGTLERALFDVPEGDSAALILRMHQLIQVVLGQDRSESEADDGLELGVCYIPPDKSTLTFAGAGFPLFIAENGEVSFLKGDRKGIGYRATPNDYSFSNHQVENYEGKVYYMTSDGLIDQIGGEKRRGFGKKRFMRNLVSLQNTPLKQQGNELSQILAEYQGDESRRDDIAVIGFEV